MPFLFSGKSFHTDLLVQVISNSLTLQSHCDENMLTKDEGKLENFLIEKEHGA